MRAKGEGSGTTLLHDHGKPVDDYEKEKQRHKVSLVTLCRGT